MNALSDPASWNMGLPVRRADPRWSPWAGESDLKITDTSCYSIKEGTGGSESQVFRYLAETPAGNGWTLVIVSNSAANVADTILEGAIGQLAKESAASSSAGVALATMPGRTSATGAAAAIARPPSRGVLRLSELPGFLDYLYLLAREDKVQTASVAAIDYIDRLLNESLFRVCNELLKQADQSQMPSALRRAFLMITWPAKDALPARSEFYQRAINLLAAERDAHTAQRMLKSLA
jgi:hypothetical protein